MGTAAIAIETEPKDERFERVALAHINSLYRSALSMSKNENDAQDLVQETYLRAYKFFDKFKEGTNCRAWLFRILRNIFINTMHYNKARPQVIYLSQMEDENEELSSDASPEDSIFGDVFDDDMSAAMKRLPDKLRTTVLLADVEELSYQEIADAMNCPVGTVMSRLHRGRRMLRKELPDYAAQHGYIGRGGDS
jgi:RNA polymerase sigma-70 factor (ECF subfamily)